MTPRWTLWLSKFCWLLLPSKFPTAGMASSYKHVLLAPITRFGMKMPQSSWYQENLEVQVNDLGSFPCSPGHSWVVFAVVQGTLSFCGVYCSWEVVLTWGSVLGLQWSLDGWCMSSGINMTARSQGFPEERCIVTRWWMLFSSPVSLVMSCLISVYLKTFEVWLQIKPWISTRCC